MKALVTGSTGFVGGALAKLLLDEGHQVRALVRPSSDRTNVKDLEIEFAPGDLRDFVSLEKAARGCDVLFHVAADYRLWAKNTDELYASNVFGTKNIMRAALEAGIERIVYTSSVATLGINPGTAVSDEDTPVSENDMIGHYKRSKFLAEQAVAEMVREQGLPATIVNPSTPVGPGDVKPTPTGRVILDAIRGKMPAFVDTGLNVVHVDDVARGHLLALEKGQVGRRYILGGQDLSLKEILVTVAERTGRKPPRIKIPRVAVYPIAYASQSWAAVTNGAEPRVTVDGLKMSRKKMYFSSARAKRELGYSARPATEALHDAADWFLQRQ